MSDKLMIPDMGPLNDKQAMDARAMIAVLQIRTERRDKEIKRLTTEVSKLRAALEVIATEEIEGSPAQATAATALKRSLVGKCQHSYNSWDVGCPKCGAPNTDADEQRTVITGVDLAKPGSDVSAFICTKCKAILDDIEAADAHECDADGEGHGDG